MGQGLTQVFLPREIHPTLRRSTLIISEIPGQLGLVGQVPLPLSQHFPPEERGHPDEDSGLPEVTPWPTGTASSAQGFPFHDVISAREEKV